MIIPSLNAALVCVLLMNGADPNKAGAGHFWTVPSHRFGEMFGLAERYLLPQGLPFLSDAIDAVVNRFSPNVMHILKIHRTRSLELYQRRVALILCLLEGDRTQGSTLPIAALHTDLFVLIVRCLGKAWAPPENAW